LGWYHISYSWFYITHSWFGQQKKQYSMKIGEKVRTLRELKNLKQENMATALGISLTAYGNLERGETPITFDKLEQIATILQVTVQDIVTMPDELTINNFNSTFTGTSYGSYNTQNVHPAEIEGYKLAITALQSENDYLKAQLAAAMEALAKK
jgi:transcriptional regulator with XRE-family HTH domain